MASYSITSLRIVPVNYFAHDEYYHIPDRIKANPEALGLYQHAMLHSEALYNDLCKMDGLKTEDARGVLPLNICSPITECISLRSLIHMIEARLCHCAQGEFREVAVQMVEEVKLKMGKEFACLFKKPCERYKVCPSPIHCGKTPYQQHEVYKSVRLS